MAEKGKVQVSGIGLPLDEDYDAFVAEAQGSIEVGQELTLDYLAQPVPERYLSSPEVRRLRPTPPV